MSFWTRAIGDHDHALLRMASAQTGEGSGTPLQNSCLENPMDGGAWWCSPWGREELAQLSDFTFPFHFHALEKEMATHSSVLAWRIPGTGVPGGLPSMGSHRVGHDWSDLAAAEAHRAWKRVLWKLEASVVKAVVEILKKSEVAVFSVWRKQEPIYVVVEIQQHCCAIIMWKVQGRSHAHLWKIT